MAPSQEPTIGPRLPSVRRVVTGHMPSGKSTVLQDTVLQPKSLVPGALDATHDVCRTNEFPAINNTEISDGEWVDEIARNPTLVSKGGSVFRSFDFAPGTVTPFHRTHSLDYAIVAKGSLVLELDDGERCTLDEGDVVVQRGTIHAWRNESENWVRIFFILLDAHPIEVNGETLGEEWREAKR